MATVSVEHTPHDFRAIKVGIVGNSNSVMQDGYVHVLDDTPGLTVTNRSIGSSPNVVLLDLLGREADLDYDFIIVETAVVDCLQAGGLYPRERSLETLELFISHVRSVSRAQIIILTIPTRFALLSPDAHWQEQLYRDTAARFGVPILDGFRLVRQLVGQARMGAVGTYLARAEQLVAAFGLSRHITTALAWRDVRDPHVQTNALGFTAFSDSAHFSAALHALVGSILADYIVSVCLDRNDTSDCPATPITPPVVAVDPSGGGRVIRASSLMSRDLITLDAGETALYECPPGYRAYGLLVNQSKTFCFLQFSSPDGSLEFDMRYRPMPFDWVGIVVPIILPIGNGLVEVTAADSPAHAATCIQLQNTEPKPGLSCAEIGELIVVKEDWRDHVAVPAVGNSTAFHLEETRWAQWAIEEAATRAASIVKGIESDGELVPRECGALVDDLFAKIAVPLSPADQARLMLLLGKTKGLLGFLDSVLAKQGDDPDPELLQIHLAVQKAFPGSNTAVRRGAVQKALSPVVPGSVARDAAYRMGDAGEVMMEASILLDVQPAMDAAAMAMAAGDIKGAQAHWRIARTAMNAPLAAWLIAAEQGGDIEAGIEPLALLQDAQMRFPNDGRLMHDLARAYEKREIWPEAEKYWRRHIALGGSHWWVYSSLAAALRAQDRDAEVDEVLRDGVLRFPAEPQMLAETARAVELRGDWPAARLVWDNVIQQFPLQWIGYRGAARALWHAGLAVEGDQFIETRAALLPGNHDAAHDLARLAERRRDWKCAESAWRTFLISEQRSSWAYLALAQSLREQARYSEAVAVVQDVLPRFPGDVDLPAEAARCAGSDGNLVEAIHYWRIVAELRPKSPAGPLGEASVLRQQGQAEAADQIILEAIKRLPDEPSLLEAYGLNAMAQEAWTEALTRLETGQRRFPSSDPLRKRIFEVRLKITEEGGVPPSAPPEDASGAEDRVLLMQFESLGGGGHGCEFGIFQRHFGAEPLGLLRWADVYQEHLSIALETEFAGIGDPEFTNIFVPDNSTEYWTTDSRYHMAMRSFVSVADVPLGRMRQQVTKRMKYLSRKLADDLRAGTKIFVYKNMKQNLTDAELQRLYTACRRYGDNTLLYIRYEDAEHPCGTVVVAGDGLLIGYIDHFSHTPDTDVYIEAATDAFLRICRNAHALWQQTISGGDAKFPPLAERLATAEIAARDGSVDTVRSLLPGLISELGDDLKGLLPIASALVSRAEFGEAETILTKMKAAMPDYFPAFEAFGMSAFHQRDWPLTISRWREIRAAFPDQPRPAVWLAAALQVTRQFDEAEEILCVASERFPSDLEIARDYARLPLSRGHVEEAVTRLATLRERFPTGVDGFAMGAEALRSLGRVDEAEMLLESVRSQFEDNFYYNFQSARNATSLGRWEDAFKRWTILLERSPDDQGVNMAVGDTITLWSLAKAEGDPAALRAELPDEIARRAGAAMHGGPSQPGTLPSYRELFMAFEGLGDRCEFGLVQRHFGAEPISLLRWSGIEPHQFIAVLESRFDGVGDAENTFVRLNENSNEYFAGDNRYFYMHTFIKKNEGDETDLFEKFRKRVAYLKRKLLADLEEGTKIFVYKINAGELTDADADAIIGAFTRHYPASRLVLMRVARDPSQVGTVEPLAGNVVWAYLSRFAENLESRFIRFDEWRDALGAAMKYFATRT